MDEKKVCHLSQEFVDNFKNWKTSDYRFSNKTYHIMNWTEVDWKSSNIPARDQSVKK